VKRVVIVSDFHSGHQAGLTHPDFDACPSAAGHRRDLYNLRRQCWNFYKDKIDALKPIDALIVNGDAIEGKGSRSGGTELITSDRTEQEGMASEAIKYAEAEMIVMSFGTPYHTGDLEDWESQVAKNVKARKIGGHDWLDVNGLIFDYRHYIGSSSVPYGRSTQISKERVWNLLWAEHGEYPKSDVIVRSHVHYFRAVIQFGWMGIVTPALQYYGTKYGTRKISGTVDFGLLSFDVEDKDNFTWAYHIWKPRRSRHHIIKA
jgi:hypothetical protein